ncbi:MAG: hypothetical protein K2Y37_09670 [Pirellulales bacterium]|nr:hypothetical protein [Pirellulales bacterium]
MNYLAHAWQFLDDPYFAAGTALPDWLGAVDRRVRLRNRHVEPHVADSDPRVAALARGVVQHHADDAWFHVSDVFVELEWRLTALARDALPADAGFRPRFLGHVLVELLLDAALAEDQPALLDRYYQVLATVDGKLIQTSVNRMAMRPTERLARLLPLFLQERFLFDYAVDAKLCRRLNQVLARVGLASLPDEFADVIGAARPLVYERRAELLKPPREVNAESLR